MFEKTIKTIVDYGDVIVSGEIFGSEIHKLRQDYQRAKTAEIAELFQVLSDAGLSGEHLKNFIYLLVASEAKENGGEVFRHYTLATGFLIHYIEKDGFGKDILNKLQTAKDSTDLLNDILVPNSLIDLYRFVIIDLLKQYDKRMQDSPDRAIGLHLLILLRHLITKNLLLSDLSDKFQHAYTMRFSQLMPLQSYAVRKFDNDENLDDFDLLVLQVGDAISQKCQDLLVSGSNDVVNTVPVSAPAPATIDNASPLLQQIANFDKKNLRDQINQAPLAERPAEVAHDPRSELVLKFKQGPIQLTHIEVQEKVIQESNPLFAAIKDPNRKGLRSTLPNIKPLTPAVITKIFSAFDREVYGLLENILKDLICASDAQFINQIKAFDTMLVSAQLNPAEIKPDLLAARAIKKAEAGPNVADALKNAIPDRDSTEEDSDVDEYSSGWDDDDAVRRLTGGP